MLCTGSPVQSIYNKRMCGQSPHILCFIPRVCKTDTGIIVKYLYKKQLCRDEHYAEEDHVDHGEHPEILLRMSRIKYAEFAERNETCKRRDKRSRAADVYTK